MASTGTFFEIKLLESDVPGAKLRCNDVNSHSVDELKRWLACRSLTTAGKKAELAFVYNQSNFYFCIYL
jgi:hypothetical protein